MEKVSVSKGDIVLFKFPFSNMIGYKKRPSIVLSGVIGGDVLLCQITSIRPEGNYLVIKNECFDKESFARINKIVSADVNRVDRIIGRVSNEEYGELVREISGLMGK
tara:strand:+ start:168 stop:488 length:321 start_codon:yes stop_codon:yes gene_type:complete